MSKHSTNAQSAHELDDAISFGTPAPLVDAATLDVAQLLAADAASTEPIPNADLMRARLLDSIVELQQQEGTSRAQRSWSGRQAGRARRLALSTFCALAAFGSAAAIAAQSDNGPGNAVRSATRVAARVLHLPQPAPTAGADKPAPKPAAPKPHGDRPVGAAPAPGTPGDALVDPQSDGKPGAPGDAEHPNAIDDPNGPPPNGDQPMPKDPNQPGMQGPPPAGQQPPPQQPNGQGQAPKPQPQPNPAPQPGGQAPPPGGQGPALPPPNGGAAPKPAGPAPAPKPAGQQPPPQQPQPGGTGADPVQ